MERSADALTPADLFASLFTLYPHGDNPARAGFAYRKRDRPRIFPHLSPPLFATRPLPRPGGPILPGRTGWSVRAASVGTASIEDDSNEEFVHFPRLRKRDLLIEWSGLRMR